MSKTTQEERDANETRNIRVINDFRNNWAAKQMELHVDYTGLRFKAQMKLIPGLFVAPLRRSVTTAQYSLQNLLAQCK